MFRAGYSRSTKSHSIAEGRLASSHRRRGQWFCTPLRRFVVRFFHIVACLLFGETPPGYKKMWIYQICTF